MNITSNVQIHSLTGAPGITPILQIIRSIFQDAQDETKVWVLDANKTETDIPFRDKFDALYVKRGLDRLKLHYVLGTAPPGWTESIGRIDDEMVQTHMPSPSEQGIILVRRPEPMINVAVKPGLLAAGWDLEKYLRSEHCLNQVIRRRSLNYAFTFAHVAFVPCMQNIPWLSTH